MRQQRNFKKQKRALNLSHEQEALKGLEFFGNNSKRRLRANMGNNRLTTTETIDVMNSRGHVGSTGNELSNYHNTTSVPSEAAGHSRTRVAHARGHSSVSHDIASLYTQD